MSGIYQPALDLVTCKVTLLECLPSELILHVASFLESGTDISSFRLTCRRIYADTFPAFGKAYFRTVHTNLGLYDINELKKLAAHAQLRKEVRKLCVCITKHPSMSYPQDFGGGYHWYRNPGGDLAEPIPMAEILSTLLEKELTNCKEFRVENVDFQPSREEYSNSQITPADAILVVLSAIMNARVPLQSFEIALGHVGYAFLDPKRLVQKPWLEPIFMDVWGYHLQKLRLNYDQEPFEIMEFSYNLIVKADRLRVLILDFRYGDFANELLRRLGNGTSLKSLEVLHLVSAKMNPNHIEELIRKVGSTVQELLFENIAIRIGTWQALLTSINSDAPFLKSISLRSIDENNSHVFFCPLREKEALGFELVDRNWQKKCRASGVRYQGANMHKALTTIVKSLYVWKFGDDGRPLSPGWPGKDKKKLGFARNFDPANDHF